VALRRQKLDLVEGRIARKEKATPLNEMKDPNFFIVGAPKSGTTSLTTYLLEHPDVYMPGTWEMNYLAEDLDWVNGPVISSDEEYFSQFEDAEGYRRVGEKSAFYLYSSVAAQRISKISPDVKIVCMLRDPVDLLWSMYRYNVQNLEETIVPFEEALAAEEDRRKGKLVPGTTTIVQNLYYTKIVDFPEQLGRYFKRFGRGNVKVIIFGNFISNTDRVYRDILSFLDLETRSLDTYEPENSGKERGFYALGLRRWLLRYPPLKQTADTLIPNWLRDRAAHFWNLLQGGVDRRLKRMNPDLRRRLSQDLSPMVERLSDVIDKDLSHWCRASKDLA